jgi:uracil-DNA glycosylase family 4
MALDPQLQRSIAAHCIYLRDLGIFDIYRRAGGPVLDEFGAAEQSASADTDVQSTNAEPEPVAYTTRSRPLVTPTPEEFAIPPRSSFPAQPPIAQVISPQQRAAALLVVRQDIGECTRCALARGRTNIVFGDGDPNARLMFVGEGPGADEDAQGLPFVGRAGQLLNNMIGAMGLKREQVYIANIVKCRPPQNRVPEPEEAYTCSPFLFRQIDIVRPEVIVALGSTAAVYLLGAKSSLSALRGRVHQCRGSKLIVTYHPAFLLRDPRQKKEAWKDLQLAMSELGLSVPAR